MQTRKNNKKGFTLTELIIVMVIIAILAVLLVPNVLAYVEKAKESTDNQLAMQVVRAANIMMVDLMADPSIASHKADVYTIHWRTDRSDDPLGATLFVGALTTDASRLDLGVADNKLEIYFAKLMGWVDENGEYPNNHNSLDLVQEAKSKIGKEDRLAIYINAKTGQIIGSEGYSAPWDDIISDTVITFDSTFS